MKKLLIISNKNLESKLKTTINDVRKNYKDIDFFNISEGLLSTEFISQMVQYDSFSNLVKKNWMFEINDLSVNKALQIIIDKQEKYLNTPIYVVYDDFEILALECGYNEFLYRFKKAS